MVYSQRLVACIKVNGQVLRETGDTVSIPFGSEYTILLKNLNSVRIQCKVHVDGTEATEGTWLVIQPNSSIELERFIRNGNLQSGNKFKFIPRSKKIEQHRGLKADDGLIRIEYQTERVTKTEDIHLTRHHYHDYHHPYFYPYQNPWWWGGGYYWGGSHYVVNNGSIGQTSGNNNASLSNASDVQFFNTSGSAPTGMQATVTKSSGIARGVNMMRSAEPIDDSGITVPGGESSQQFFNAAPFQVHNTTDVLVLKLRGQVGGVAVEKPVTVKSKKKCSTCGKANKGNQKFCSECGTALALL